VVALDVNLLLYCFRSELPQHARARERVGALRSGDAPWAIPADVIAGFLRLSTNPRVFRTPSPMEESLRFVKALRASPSMLVLRPGGRHLDIFLTLCRTSQVRGKLVPDAWLAALAIEHGCTWWSCDRDFSRFADLDWIDPLAGG
jgi:toxin-antitoxin system PIN domain toxin